MFEIIRKIFDAEYAEIRGQKEALVRDAIAHVVEGTDPRLRMISGYERKLYHAVETALDYTSDLVDKFSDPLDLRKSAFATDPYIHAYFASAKEITELLRYSQSFREFVAYQDNKALNECYAMLAMKKEEKKILGIDMEGDIIKRDVPQIAVNYSDHRLITPGISSAITKQKLKERAFSHLIETSLERIVSLRHRKGDLEVQRNLLRSKLTALRKSGNFGLEDELQTANLVGTETKKDYRELQEIEKELKGLITNPLTLDDYLAEINSVMSHPENHLRSQRTTVKVDRMGIKLSDHSNKQAETLSLQEVELGNAIRFVVSLIRIPGETMRNAYPL